MIFFIVIFFPEHNLRDFCRVYLNNLWRILYFKGVYSIGILKDFFHSWNPSVFNWDYLKSIKILEYSIEILNYATGGIQLGFQIMLKNPMIFNWDCLKSIKIWRLMDFFGLNKIRDFVGLVSVFYVFWNHTKINEILKDCA